MSCVSGGGYTGSAFADWAYQRGIHIHPREWIDEFISNMRTNVGYLCTCKGFRAVTDTLALVGVMGLMILLMLLSYGPEGVLVTYLIDLLVGDVLRGNSSISTGILVMILVGIAMGVWILRVCLNVVNKALHGRLQRIVDLVSVVLLLMVMAVLMVGAFWVEFQLRQTVIDEIIHASVIAAFVLTVGIPWAISRSISLQFGFFLLATAYGRFLMWRVMQDQFLFVLQYTELTWGILVALSSALVVRTLSRQF